MKRRHNLRLGPPSVWRARFVLCGFVVFAAVLGGRAFELQVLHHEFLNREGDKRYLRSIAVPAVRGTIYDRNGVPLAVSAPTESVWAVPGALLEAPEKITPLAAHLEMSAAKLRTTLQANRDRKFLYLQRQLSPAHARRVMAVGAPGVFLQREYRRYYPAAEVAAQLVGITDIDGRGIGGIELALNKRLDGEAGSRRVIKNRLGQVVEDLSGMVPAQPGQDVHLTIDLRLQSLVYRKVKEAVLAHDAKAGEAVIMAPDSGEILAAVSYPSYNPNNRASITPAALRHRAFTDTYEPGSSVKPLLISQAITTGAFGRQSVIETGGPAFRVSSNLVVHDFRDYGDVTLKRLLVKSSNIGAAKVGLTLGAKTVWQAYHAYGLGQRTGIRFPGEAFGVLRPYYSWGRVETATASYGYGLSVTAVQEARAYCAIANHGKLPSASLLRGPAAVPPRPPRQVVPAWAADRVRELMVAIVTPEGTATLAAVPGYKVAGKTGTVRAIGSAGGYNDAHQAIFMGMAPADDPALVMAIMVDEPTKGGYYGGLIAAPIFADVMGVALRMLRIPPQQSKTLTVDAGVAPGTSS
ncbi:MAG: penicillin-binding protein 2 [Salinisphaera sp.]|nr:penicillin-binding protein 2 [Salinisphaera sp.]